MKLNKVLLCGVLVSFALASAMVIAPAYGQEAAVQESSEQAPAAVDAAAEVSKQSPCDCKGKCKGDCKGKCKGDCKGKCKGDCKGKCKGDCKGKCKHEASSEQGHGHDDGHAHD